MERSYLLWAQGLGLLAAAVLVLVGSIQPWFDIGADSVSGFGRGEGRSTFALGVALFATGAIRLLVPHRSIDVGVTMVAAGCSAAIIALALPIIMDIRSVQNANLLTFLAPPAVGQGLQFTMAGGSLAGLSSLIGLALPFTRERSIGRAVDGS